MPTNKDQVMQTVSSLGYEEISQSEFLKQILMTEDEDQFELAKKFNKLIMDGSFEQIVNTSIRVVDAIVKRVNGDGTVDVILLNSTNEKEVDWSGVQNQTIYQNLKAGDAVKIVNDGGKSNNRWIFAVYNSTQKYSVKDYTKENFEIMMKYCSMLNGKIAALSSRIQLLETNALNGSVVVSAPNSATANVLKAPEGSRSPAAQIAVNNYNQTVSKLKSQLPHKDSQGNVISYPE